MRVVSGPLIVRIKYTEERPHTTIFQRGIRTSVRHHYGGQTKVAVDLKTKDPVLVARMVAQLSAQLEAEWDALEQDPGRSPRAVVVQADALLKRWGLRPLAKGETTAIHDQQALELLQNHFDSKREAHAGDEEEVYRDAPASEFLTPPEIVAWRRLHVPPVDTVEDLLQVYLNTHPKQGDKADKLQRDAQATFRNLTAVIGNKNATDVNRQDAHAFVAARLERGDSTSTVRRKLNTLGAAWKRYRLEQAPTLSNPFEALPIPNEGDDKTKREPFTAAQLQALYAACRTKDDDLRWLFALMIDTGARLAEVAGLAISDIHLDDPIPHVVIQAHPWRGLKNTNSARSVPLVGASLWAAQRLMERAGEMAGTDTAVYAFPRYTTATECKATYASNALAKWVEKTVGRGVSHELRHTLKDRLRDVECPKPINDALTGHMSQDVGDSYGHGYSLAVKQKWLSRIAMGEPGAAGKAPPA